jgi:hypothetical protein
MGFFSGIASFFSTTKPNPTVINAKAKQVKEPNTVVEMLPVQIKAADNAVARAGPNTWANRMRNLTEVNPELKRELNERMDSIAADPQGGGRRKTNKNKSKKSKTNKSKTKAAKSNRNAKH